MNQFFEINIWNKYFEISIWNKYFEINIFFKQCVYWIITYIIIIITNSVFS